MTDGIRRITLDEAKKLRGLSNSKKIRETTEQDIERQIDEDPDLYHLTDDELKEFKPVKDKQ